MSDIVSRAEALTDELTALRHQFHSWPERGNREFKTAERIEQRLDALNIPHRRLLDTAVVARLEGGMPGRTVALRADMDALPLQEATGADYMSQNPGVMHACGHDVHMTAALGAAQLLAERRESLPGAVVFLFQPDEECYGGARRMIEAGVLEGVDAVFGCHVSPDLPLGCAGFRRGKFYAAADNFFITMHGRSTHAAMRERGVDALAAASELVPALIALPEQLPGERCVVSVGTLNAGTAINIVPDRAELTGIMRTLGPDARERMRDLSRRAALEVASRHGATAEYRLVEGYPGIVNDDAMSELAFGAARDALGAERVCWLDEPTLITEDFGFFLQQRPGAFYHVGAGCSLPLHNTAFLPDDRAAVTAAAVHAAVIEAFLRA